MVKFNLTNVLSSCQSLRPLQKRKICREIGLDDNCKSVEPGQALLLWVGDLCTANRVDTDIVDLLITAFGDHIQHLATDWPPEDGQSRPAAQLVIGDGRFVVCSGSLNVLDTWNDKVLSAVPRPFVSSRVVNLVELFIRRSAEYKRDPAHTVDETGFSP